MLISEKEQLLKVLRCVECKVKVELKPDNSGLKCPQCKRVYPVKDDLPIMLLSEAHIEEND